MFHLFKRVYVASDDIIDFSVNRVVISDINGFHDADASVNQIAFANDCEDLIGSGKDKQFKSWIDFFRTMSDFTDTFNNNKKVVIYCDDDNFIKVMCAWYKIIFKDPSEKTCLDLLESNVFRYRVFGQGRWAKSFAADANKSFDLKNFKTHWAANKKPTIALRNKFIEDFKGTLNVELLLATYLANGEMKVELKKAVKTMLSLDLEKYLYELKELFFTHIMTKKYHARLPKALKMQFVYNFGNYDTSLNDDSPIAELFLSERIWNAKTMRKPTAAKNIKFNNITSADIKLFKHFDSTFFNTDTDNPKMMKSESYKLNWIDAVNEKEFSDKLLNKIIENESSFNNLLTPVFSMEQSTVNNYLVTALFEAHNDNDKGFLKNFAIM